MRSYGANTYRFSLAWTRIIPNGGRDDPINEQGIEFYNAVIDECLRLGMTPFVTLFQYVPLSKPPDQSVQETEGLLAGTLPRRFTTDTEDSWTKRRLPKTFCDTQNYVMSDLETVSSTG
jgi:beta-glucosidase/6-phospho-beta-glucosidase/beta-galactosidase